ncbi:hypothetical protein [Streptomyces zhihengii]
MAITVITAEDPIDDWTTYKECVTLLADTGEPACEKTLRRWVDTHQLPTRRRLGRVEVSFSDVLQVHRDVRLRPA